MRLAVGAALFVACFAVPFAVRWWRLRRWGLPVRIIVDPDDPTPSAIAAYLAEVACRLDERPERMRLVIEASNAEGRAVTLDFTPTGEMVVSVDGHRSKKMSLRHRWILRLYVDPVDANRFRVMSAVPCPVPAGLYVACSLLATVGAILVSPECLTVALGLTLGLWAAGKTGE